MVESKRMIISKLGRKNCLIENPKLRCTIWSSREKSVSILAVDLYGIQYWKWNAEQLIIFQSVILQRVQLDTGAKNICAQIEFQLDFWNCGAFDELVKNTHTATTRYTGDLAGSEVRSNVITLF